MSNSNLQAKIQQKVVIVLVLCSLLVCTLDVKNNTEIKNGRPQKNKISTRFA